ncbi:MAG: hypothetical protein RLN78_11535 [Phycisphaerales bacterium]
MTQHAINRREFVAISAATAATAALSTPSLASATASPTRPLRFPAPTLARVLPLSPPHTPSNSHTPAYPTSAKLRPHTLCTNPSTTPLATPSITITPLACIENRLAPNASIIIEILHPTPNIYTNLLRAHNTNIPSQSIPDFASTISTKAPRNTLNQTTLRITQQIDNRAQSNRITLSTKSAASYLLAIPTAGRSANAAWRFTSASLDQAGNITKLNNPLPAASSRCAYFSITIQEHPNELLASNLDDISAGE